MLAFKEIDVRLAGIAVLRRVSFKIEPGSTVALIGRNGAGKTTTLRTVMGFTEIVHGSVLFDGKDMTHLRPDLRPKLGIGYAPEDRRLFSAFTVVENIRLPGEVARLSEQEISRRLSRVYDLLPELKVLAERPAGQVSGGQGKMVALGRALMLGDRLVLLDEPFQGLAPVLANRYAEALRALRNSEPSLALVITESNPALIRSFADRTLVIERGAVSDADPNQMEAA